MSGYEHMLPGGIYDPKEEVRTDVYLNESGPGEGIAEGEPFTFDFQLVSGSISFHCVELLHEDVVRLGKWMISTAQPFVKKKP